LKIEEKIKEMGLSFPTPPTPKGAYKPVVRTGNLIFSSGTGSNVNGVRLYTGKVGLDVSISDAQESAKLALLNNLANIKAEVGSLDSIRIIKLTGFVNSAPGFTEQAKVIDGASLFLEKIMGEKGKHARSAIGVCELPFNLSVEIEMVVEVQSTI